MNMMWSPNPRKRRGKRKMSAKQRKYFGKRSRRRSSVVAVAAPVVHRRRRSRRSAVRVSRRRARRSFGGFRASGAISLLKAGFVGGAGAVLVDVGMGQVRGFLPASMSAPMDANGGPNYGYYAAKAGLAIALGLYGSRLPVIGRYAGSMSEGALTVLAYQFLRPMVPANLSLGAYFNPAPMQRPRQLSGVGAYASIPVRAGSGGGRGGRAAQVLSAVSINRKAA